MISRENKSGGVRVLKDTNNYCIFYLCLYLLYSSCKLAYTSTSLYGFIIRNSFLTLTHIEDSACACETPATAAATNNSSSEKPHSSTRNSSQGSSKSADSQATDDGDQFSSFAGIPGSMCKPFSQFDTSVSRGRGSEYTTILKQIQFQTARRFLWFLALLLTLQLLASPSAAAAISDAGGGNYNSNASLLSTVAQTVEASPVSPVHRSEAYTGDKTFLDSVFSLVEGYQILYVVGAVAFLLYIWVFKILNAGFERFPDDEGENDGDDDSDGDSEDGDGNDYDDDDSDDDDDGGGGGGDGEGGNGYSRSEWVTPIPESSYPHSDFPGFMDSMSVQQESLVHVSQQVAIALLHGKIVVFNNTFNMPTATPFTAPTQVEMLSTVAFWPHPTKRPSLIFPLPTKSAEPQEKLSAVLEHPLSSSGAAQGTNEFQNSFSPSWPTEVGPAAIIPIATCHSGVLLQKRNLYNAPTTSILFCDSTGLVSPLKNEESTKVRQSADDASDYDGREEDGDIRVCTGREVTLAGHFTTAACVALAVRVIKTEVQSTCLCVASIASADSKQSDPVNSVKHPSLQAVSSSVTGRIDEEKDVVLDIGLFSSYVDVQHSCELEPLEVQSPSAEGGELSSSLEPCSQHQAQESLGNVEEAAEPAPRDEDYEPCCFDSLILPFRSRFGSD